MAKVTRFGLQIPSFKARSGTEGLFEQVADVAVRAEESGFDSIWVMDHFFQIPPVGPIDEPMFEAYTLLGGLAARTKRASLGALVTGVTYRNPALLAKQVTAIDVLSDGRAILGIGAAWFDKEHDALGFSFPPASERLDRLEEALQICRAMFVEDAATFEGRYYKINRAVNRPRPVRPGGPPILVGGGGERRTLRLVAQYADACNIFGDAATVRHKLSVLQRHCETVGRDPQTVTKTRLGTLLVAGSEKDSNAKLSELAARTGLPEEAIRGQLTVGGPDRIVEEVGELFEAGLDGLVFNMPDSFDLEAVELAGRTLTDAFGGLQPDR
jgi:F420-dependent oxidoreductase-like protein